MSDDSPNETAEKIADRLSGKLHPKCETVKATKELPILRITNDSVDRLNFDELLSENLDYPDFAETVGNQLIKVGMYNDSDRSSFTFVVYTTSKPEALKKQMKKRSDFVEVYY